MTVGSCGIRCSRSGLRRISFSAPTAGSCGDLHQFQCLFSRRDLKHAGPKKGASIGMCFYLSPALSLSKTSVSPVSRSTCSAGRFFSGRHTCGEQEKMPHINSIPICVGRGAGPSEKNMRKSGVGSSEKPVKTVRFLSSSIDKAKQKQYNINEHLFYCR